MAVNDGGLVSVLDDVDGCVVDRRTLAGESICHCQEVCGPGICSDVDDDDVDDDDGANVSGVGGFRAHFCVEFQTLRTITGCQSHNSQHQHIYNDYSCGELSLVDAIRV